VRSRLRRSRVWLTAAQLVHGSTFVFVVLAVIDRSMPTTGVAIAAVLAAGSLIMLAWWERRAPSSGRPAIWPRRGLGVVELRTPLSMIKGATELLLEQSPGPVTRIQEQFMRSIAQQCNQVIRLCEGLLVQAKIETGLFEPGFAQTDMSVLVRDVVVAMRPLCAERNQQISLDTPQVVSAIPVDPGLVLQALTNLLSNASRFTSNGGRIDVRLVEIDDGMAIYVSDDGDGMTREQRAQLFRRFATGRPLADGTGLGLVITKDIVELHGGSIMVDTTARRGTTFVVTLPAVRPT
jgi:two-component system OmpR family sensor kinase